ncbi:CheR family methyltransferase [Oryzifoliimicrobium ureilyticus]|uniref:CheR family methyltransferase n=1 Tax=Oryzifoliimicrobium ureilyticus TaxID=3113724 RepID=UPI00307666A5
MSIAVAETPSVNERLSQRNFQKLANFIYDYCGIKMPPSKLTMLEGRLRRRLRVTQHSSFDEYCDYLFNHDGLEEEAVYLIDVVTTNKTDFFREPKHFEYMQQTALPTLLASGVTSLRVWSSACSTGAEPYTIAMLLADFAAARSNFAWRVLATDISTEVLETAHRGIYHSDLVLPVPSDMKKKYVMVSRKHDRNEVRISPRLRSNVGFARMNLMDSAYSIGDPVHIIFCRNVLIYFDKETQQKVLSRLCDCLHKDGYMFIGHSETVGGFDLPLKQVANTVFRKI